MDQAGAQAWLGRYLASCLGESQTHGAWTRDEPDTYSAQYTPLAVDDDMVVATGTFSYRTGPDGPIAGVYHNCSEMRFDAEGRCREFAEYYIRQP
jgi:hypothetical protein